MTDYDAVKQTIEILARSDLLDEIEQFIEVFQKKRLVPANILGYDLYSFAYAKAKKFKQAVAYGELALESAESFEQRIAVMSNLSKMCLNANDPLRAKDLMEIVLEHTDERDHYLLDYSAILFACGLKDKAFDIINNMLPDLWKYDQQFADSILFNLGVHHIRRGDFKLGMEHLDVGRKMKVFGSYNSVDSLPLWDGNSYPGKHVLMVSEGGLGDEIINVRFAKKIKDLNMRVSIMTSHNTKEAYSHMGFERIITKKELTHYHYDFWTPMMSLPKTLGLDVDQLWGGPYLVADNTHIKKFESIVTGDYRVGIRWAGNPRYDHELHRTIQLQPIVDQLSQFNCTLYSLQRDVGLEQLNDTIPIVDLNTQLETFSDLLGCLYHLDLVITSCTSIAHVAAALGKSVIILIPIMEYYIWAEGKPYSSWYGDRVRIIRQIHPNNWDSAYSELNEILKEYIK